MVKNRNIKRAYNAFIIFLIILGACYACSRLFHFGHNEWTDDAVVVRHVSPINSRIEGFIKEIRFEDYQYVHKGDTLVVIEDAEYRYRLAQAEAGVKGQRSGSGAVRAGITTTQSNVAAASGGVAAADASVEEARAGMENARKDYLRYQSLVSKDAVTQQQYDQMATRYAEAKARYEAAVARRQQASASKQSTHLVQNEQQHRLSQQHAGVSVAQAALNIARLNLSYTVITAPCDGYMGKKDIHVGQLLQPGQLVAKIVDEANLWILANYRETQMKHIKVGSKVKLTADAVPDVTYHGTVQAISASTGAGYGNMASVDNATGNFVKVEQRVPVRIVLDKNTSAADRKKLLAGLNVETEVDY